MNMPLDATAEMTDESLLALYARGDAGAARALTARLTPKVFAHAYRLLGDRAEAEDVAQEALLRLWRIAPKWQPGRAQVATWLYRVVANLCTDRLRRHRAVGLDAAPETADSAPTVEDGLTQRSRVDALQAALLKLPDRQRQAVVLRHIEGLSNPEIAQIMELSTEAVESLTARGKRALATALAPRKEELGFEDG
jgi:RNA polymerase sigma-70 factor (ECF subfamily)